MKTLILLLNIFFTSTLIGQSYNFSGIKDDKNSSDKRIKQLEKMVDSLQFQIFLEGWNRRNDIRKAMITSRLALELNRNIVYFGTYFEEYDTSFNITNCKFVGYYAKDYFNTAVDNNAAQIIDLMRKYVIQIYNIINYDGLSYLRHVTIDFCDNANNNDTFISYDSNSDKVLKMRLHGIMKDVGIE